MKVNLRKGDKLQYTDIIGLGTTPRIKEGDIVEYVKKKGDKIYAKHKRKQINFHYTNYTKGWFVKLK